MNQVLRFLLLSLPALSCSICGGIFMFFWFRNKTIGVLDLDQTLMVSIGCYVTSLLYLITLGGCYSRGKCKPKTTADDDTIELIEG